jgi:excisionase family DNA binding protein
MSDALQASFAPTSEGVSQSERELGFFKPASTVREAVEATGLSRTTLYKASKAGRLVAFRNGRTRLFPGRDLAAYMLELYRATRTKPTDHDGTAGPHHERGEISPTGECIPACRWLRLRRPCGKYQGQYQREPITVLDRLILDGRNRYRACLAIGINPQAVDFAPDVDGDPLAFVISKNLRRRHMDESMRAMVGARLETLRHAAIVNRMVKMQICTLIVRLLPVL